MYSKKILKDSDLEDIDNIIGTPYKNKKRDRTNLWGNNDDDSSDSSLKNFGRSQNFFKKNKVKASDHNTEKESVSEEVPEISVHYFDEDSASNKLFNNDANKSDSETNVPKDDGPYPLTFEGTTEFQHENKKDDNEMIGENMEQTTTKASVPNLFTRDEFNSTGNLDSVNRENLLSKVSLLDSNEYGKLERTVETTEGIQGNMSNDAFHIDNIKNNKNDVPVNYISGSFNQSSMNPASGDSHNYTQGFTNVTDTVVGDTTVADLMKLQRRLGEGDNETQKIFTDDDKENKLSNEQPKLKGTFTKENHLKPLISDMRENNLIHSDELRSNSENTASPTPRPRKSLTNGKIESKDVNRLDGMSNKKSNSSNKRKYANVPSSGYGVKPIHSSENRPTSAKSSLVATKSILTPQRKSYERATSATGNRRSDRKKDKTANVEQVDLSPPDYTVERKDGRAKEWQDKWLEECKKVKKLQIDMDILDRDYKLNQADIIKRFEGQISQLEMQLAQQKKSRADLTGRELKDGITREEIAKLTKEIEEQESLINGYERDNKRLYDEIKQFKEKEKSVSIIDRTEHDRLIAKLASVQSELEMRDIQMANLKKMLQEYKKPPDVNPDCNNQLCAEEMAYLKAELRKVNQKYIDSERERQKFSRQIEKFESEVERLICQFRTEMQTEQVEKEKLKESHSIEVQNLKDKIKWYLENQAILNNESKKIKQKDKEIMELRRQLQSSNVMKISSNVRAKEKTVDQNRIKKLEDENLSLKSELYAITKDKNLGNITSKRSVQFLEERIKQLEKDKDDSVEKEKMNLRSMQQQFEIIQDQYEEKIRDLELDLSKNTDHHLRQEKESRITALRKSVEDLNKKLHQKNEIINKMKKEHHQHPQQPFDTTKSASSDGSLKREIRKKELEIEHLKLENDYLKNNENRKSADRDVEIDADKSYLKSQVAHLNGELNRAWKLLEQQKEDQMRMEENIRLNHQTEIAELDNYHKEQLRNVKIDFSNRHSESDSVNYKSQLDLQKNFISHLRKQIEELTAKLNEQVSKQKELDDAKMEIQNLNTELRDLRVIWSNKPGLEMIERLRAKVNDLESKEAMKSQYLDGYVEKVVKQKTEQLNEENSRLKSVVTKKNQNLIRVQHELNQLLDALEELKKQGIVIPKMSSYKNEC